MRGKQNGNQSQRVRTTASHLQARAADLAAAKPISHRAFYRSNRLGICMEQSGSKKQEPVHAHQHEMDGHCTQRSNDGPKDPDPEVR